jgi:rhodanese-related sulfurtransferase
MGTYLVGFFRRTGLLGDVGRVAIWAVIALLLAACINRLSPGRLPLWPSAGQRAAIPLTTWEKLKFAEADAATPSRRALLLDVREPRDYARAHPPGAVNLPYREFSSFFPDFRSTTDRRRPLYVYCYGSQCDLSLRVANRLLQNGFADVTVVRGGFEAWQARVAAGQEGGERHG